MGKMVQSEVFFGGNSFVVSTEESGVPQKNGYLFKSRQIEVEHLMEDPEFYRHGWNSWSPTGWRKLSQKPLKIYDNPLRLLTADDAEHFEKGKHSGSYVAALTDSNGNCLLLGSLSVSSGFIIADNSYLNGFQNDLNSEWYIGYGNEREVFKEYANLLTEKFGINNLKAGNVWSSWYTFFEDINSRDLKLTIDQLESMEIDVIQIDDGWQLNVGDWSANKEFPEGMNEIATYIKSKGKKAGLWVAPLICLPESEVVKNHPDWILRDEKGEAVTAGYNWGTTYYTFDTTLPEVQKHIFEIFTNFKDWGFEYFKLDFMYAGALPGYRSTKIDREVAYRNILKVIRSAVGDEIYLLGSGVPMLPSIGIFNGVRVGPDTAPYWDNTERKNDPSGPGAWNAICNSLSRYWMKGIYETDPDAVFFRSRQNLLDDSSKHLLQATAQILEFKSFSDPIDWLDENEYTELINFLNSSNKINQLNRYIFEVDGVTIDFNDIIFPKKRISDFILVK
jgi:alpha-galactosidase